MQDSSSLPGCSDTIAGMKFQAILLTVAQHPRRHEGAHSCSITSASHSSDGTCHPADDWSLPHKEELGSHEDGPENVFDLLRSWR
jgi:hypothetical protein